MLRRHERPYEFIALPTAAILVYYEVMGTRLSFQEVSEMSEVLQRVAHAISNVSPIYGQVSDTAKREPLSQVDLLFGVFQRGATLFRTPYAEFTNLAVRRADAFSATPSASRRIPSSRAHVLQKPRGFTPFRPYGEPRTRLSIGWASYLIPI